MHSEAHLDLKLGLKWCLNASRFNNYFYFLCEAEEAGVGVGMGVYIHQTLTDGSKPGWHCLFPQQKQNQDQQQKIHKTQIVFVFKKVCLIRQKLNLSLQCLILHQIVKTCAIHTMACAADTRNNNSISKRDHFHTWKYFCQKRYIISPPTCLPHVILVTQRDVSSVWQKKKRKKKKKKEAKFNFHWQIIELHLVWWKRAVRIILVYTTP